MAVLTLHADFDLAHADWPKRTPDTFAALGIADQFTEAVLEHTPGGHDHDQKSHGRKRLSDGEYEQNFKQWFADSKVVDSNGEPLVVYHGTRAVFDAFRTELPDSDWGMLDRLIGPHFAEDKDVPDAFTIKQYAWPSDFNVAQEEGRSWYRDLDRELRWDGIRVVVTRDTDGVQHVERYDQEKHGATWGIRDRLGNDAHLRIVPPGGSVKPLFLSIHKKAPII